MDTSQKNLPRDIYFRDAIYETEQIKNTLTYAKSHVNTYLRNHNCVANCTKYSRIICFSSQPFQN